MKGMHPKILRSVAGNSVLWHVLCAFDEASSVDNIVLVVPKNMCSEYIKIISCYNINKSLDIIEGKDNRMGSVLSGLNAVGSGCEFVAIHDAARVQITPDVIDATFAAAKCMGAAIATGPVFDTIKEVKDGIITATVDRNKLQAAYTPQVFDYELLKTAYETAISEGYEGTDSASVMERAGHKVAVFNTKVRDIKITLESDIALVEAGFTGGSIRCGTGFDTHRLIKGRKLILGGVHIPFDMGLLGHSDADVLIHAIMDSLLGGAGMHDIGYHFPESNDEYKSIYSMKLLEDVNRKLKENDFEIINIDSTIICQKPKLSKYNDEMVKNISSALNLDKSQVNIKATTTEGIGDHGKSEAISAMAVCALRSSTSVL